MPLLTILTRDSAVREAAVQALTPDRTFGPAQVHEVAMARTWDRLTWLVRERPVTGVVLDSGAVTAERPPEEAVSELTRRFASVATVFVHRPGLDPVTFFRLGRAGVSGLALVRFDGLVGGLRDAVARAAENGTEARVLRAVGGRLPTKEEHALRLALNGAQLGWGTDDLAQRAGMTRAHLSVRLKRAGLPSLGHLLLWGKLLNAGRWMEDTDRTAESVSRQLEYASGAAFRRALHNYVGCTPTQLRERGGLQHVLARFLDVCGLRDSLDAGRSVA